VIPTKPVSPGKALDFKPVSVPVVFQPATKKFNNTIHMSDFKSPGLRTSKAKSI